MYGGLGFSSLIWAMYLNYFGGWFHSVTISYDGTYVAAHTHANHIVVYHASNGSLVYSAGYTLTQTNRFLRMSLISGGTSPMIYMQDYMQANSATNMGYSLFAIPANKFSAATTWGL